MCVTLLRARVRIFHTGANEKQPIYPLIYKCMCAYGGERVGLCNWEHPGENQGSHPRTAVLGGGFNFASPA